MSERLTAATSSTMRSSELLTDAKSMSEMLDEKDLTRIPEVTTNKICFLLINRL